MSIKRRTTTHLHPNPERDRDYADNPPIRDQSRLINIGLSHFIPTQLLEKHRTDETFPCLQLQNNNGGTICSDYIPDLGGIPQNTDGRRISGCARAEL